MSEPKTKTVAVIGAGGDPARYANKSVRAHLKAGYRVCGFFAPSGMFPNPWTG